MTARTEAAGVAGALDKLARAADIFDDAGNPLRAAVTREALATLQSRLLAADELREAAANAVLLGTSPALRKLAAALAAYDSTGSGPIKDASQPAASGKAGGL